MKILYLSCHSILEHDEVKLFTEMGHEVFSLGAYQNPKSPQDIKRPAIDGFYNDHLQSVAIQCSKENLHDELIEWADVIMIMHRPDWVLNNWSKIKHKKVIWRSIGQSTPDIESALVLPRSQGLKLVRYSPFEEKIGGYLGHDAVIRFYKDPDEFGNHCGILNEVLTVSQSMKARGDYCHFDVFNRVTQNFPRALIGPNNEDSGIAGGQVPFEQLKDCFRRYAVYFYTGTFPASYTLNFIEAFMTGIPVVAIGPRIANLSVIPNCETYEVANIIQNGINGFWSDDEAVLRGNVDFLLSNPLQSKEIGLAGRKTAIELFGKEVIKNQWVKYLESL